MNNIYNPKSYFKNRFAYDWWKYIAVTLVVCLLWYYAFYLTDRLKPTEKIQIFTSAEITDLKIEKELEDQFLPQGIYDYFFYRVSEENRYFDVALSSQGFENSDILILPEEALTEETLAGCAAFDDALINRCLALHADLSFLEGEGKTYGVRIYIAGDDAYNEKLSFCSWLKPDKNYCMVFSAKSKNIGRLSPKADEKNDKAILTYLYLLERK